MIDKEGINSLTAPLAYALSLYGVVLASRHRLKRWTAISQLLPPSTTANVETKPEPVIIQGWRRFFTRDMIKRYGLFVGQLGLQGFIAFGLPRLSSRTFLDVFWGLLLFALVTFCIGSVSTIIVPDTSTVQYNRETTGFLVIRTDHILPESTYNRREHLRTFVAMSTAAATFISAYYGYTTLQCLSAAGWPILIIAGLGMPTLSVKKAVQVMLGFQIGIPTLAGLLMLGIHMFTNIDTSIPPNHPSRGVASPSPWILSMMSTTVHGMAVIGPGVLLAMTYRFEHSRSSPSIQLRTSQPVKVPAAVPSFPAPLFRAGMTGLGLIMSSTPVIQPILIEQVGKDSTGAWPIFFTVPAVLLTLVGEAWRRDLLKEWWNYKETWLPNEAEIEYMIMEHTEQALAYGDEKASDEDTVEARL